jgi:hypothetical protein
MESEDPVMVLRKETSIKLNMVKDSSKTLTRSNSIEKKK